MAPKKFTSLYAQRQAALAEEKSGAKKLAPNSLFGKMKAGQGTSTSLAPQPARSAGPQAATSASDDPLASLDSDLPLPTGGTAPVEAERAPQARPKQSLMAMVAKKRVLEGHVSATPGAGSNNSGAGASSKELDAADLQPASLTTWEAPPHVRSMPPRIAASIRALQGMDAAVANDTTSGGGGAAVAAFPNPTMLLSDLRMPPPLEHALDVDLRIKSLRPTQQHGMSSIMLGYNAVLIGPPHCGKTTTALLPAVSLAVESAVRSLVGQLAAGVTADVGADRTPRLLVLCPNRHVQQQVTRWIETFVAKVPPVETAMAPPPPFEEDVVGSDTKPDALAAEDKPVGASPEGLPELVAPDLPPAPAEPAAPVIAVGSSTLTPCDVVVQQIGEFADDVKACGVAALPLQRLDRIVMLDADRSVIPPFSTTLDAVVWDDLVSGSACDRPTPRQVILTAPMRTSAVDDFCAKHLAADGAPSTHVVSCQDQSPWYAIMHKVEYCRDELRLQYLSEVLCRTPPPVLIFAHNRADSASIVSHLQLLGVRVTDHAGSFRKGDDDVLVATEGAIRGVPLPSIRHVINLRAPSHDVAPTLSWRARACFSEKARRYLCLMTTLVSRTTTNERSADALRSLLVSSGQEVPGFLHTVRSFNN